MNFGWKINLRSQLEDRVPALPSEKLATSPDSSLPVPIPTPLCSTRDSTATVPASMQGQPTKGYSKRYTSIPTPMIMGDVPSASASTGANRINKKGKQNRDGKKLERARANKNNIMGNNKENRKEENDDRQFKLQGSKDNLNLKDNKKKLAFKKENEKSKSVKENLSAIRHNYWIDFKNKAIINNNIKQVRIDRNNDYQFCGEVSEGIIELHRCN